MRNCRFVILPLLLLAAGAFAQSAAPDARVQSHTLVLQPVSSSSVHYRDNRDVTHAHAKSVFKFKQPEAETQTPPQSIPGQPTWMRAAPLRGRGKMGADGRPPIDCQRTPMDRQCR
jgi:hypothetical protein